MVNGEPTGDDRRRLAPSDQSELVQLAKLSREEIAAAFLIPRKAAIGQQRSAV